MVLGGEAGVGKTRLLAHVAAGLAESGILVLRGVAGLTGVLPDGDALVRLVAELTIPAGHRDGRADVFDAVTTALTQLSANGRYSSFSTTCNLGGTVKTGRSPKSCSSERRR